MRSTSILVGFALLLVTAGAVLAASPTPTPYKAPSATPGATATPAPSKPTTPSATPAPTATPRAATSAPAATSWSAAIMPIGVTTGTAAIQRSSDGTGTLTITLHGLRPDTAWTVDIDSGTSTSASDHGRRELVSRSGMGVERVSSDTVRVHLSKAEMALFDRERSANGVAVLVTDGTDRSAAVFKRP